MGLRNFINGAGCSRLIECVGVDRNADTADAGIGKLTACDCQINHVLNAGKRLLDIAHMGSGRFMADNEGIRL